MAQWPEKPTREEGELIGISSVDWLLIDYEWYGYASGLDAIRGEGLRAAEALSKERDPDRREMLRGYLSKFD